MIELKWPSAARRSAFGVVESKVDKESGVESKVVEDPRRSGSSGPHWRHRREALPKRELKKAQQPNTTIHNV